MTAVRSTWRRRSCGRAGIWASRCSRPAPTRRPTRPSWNGLSVRSTRCSASTSTGTSGRSVAMRGQGPGGRGGVHRRAAAGPVRRMGGRGLAEPAARIVDPPCGARAGRCHPNEAYAAMVARSGYVPVPRSAADYVELLPAEWRRINEDGITFDNRVYDSRRAQPLPAHRFRGARRRTAGGKSTTTPTTSPRSGSATTTTAGGSPRPGCTATSSGSRSARRSTNMSGPAARPPGHRSGDDYIARRVAEMLDPGRRDRPIGWPTRRAVAPRTRTTRRDRPARPSDSASTPRTPADDADGSTEGRPGPDDDPTDGRAADRPGEGRTGRQRSAGFPVFRSDERRIGGSDAPPLRRRPADRP